MHLTDDNNYRLLVEAVIDYAIYMLDVEGCIVSWNPGAQRFKGYAAEEVTGTNFARFYTAQDRAAGVPRLALERAATEGRYENEGWRVRKDGTRFWAHVVIDPIRDAEGSLIGFAKITRDVTEQHAAARELDEAREALFQSQKIEAVGKLTGGVAHDFNNLLMAVHSCLELLDSRVPEDPKVKFLIENAKSGVLRGSALTQRMLAFARRQELRPTPVDIAMLVRGMADLLQHAIGPQVVIDTSFPPALAKVLVDANQLELALMNLVVNAQDAMPDGGRITISARQERVDDGHPSELAADNYVCLSVRDEGAGMDAATLARCVEPFYTTKGVGKGTGLGLSMAHGLAEQSGGRLDVRSAVGRGTTIETWLPVARADAPAPPAATPVAVAAGATSPPLRILLVDDDALVLPTVSAQLEDLGHQVTAAASAVQALETLAGTEPFDLLITDHAMPGMTGIQLVDQVRAQHPGLATILATGYAELPAESGCDILRLRKPFSQRELAAAVAASVSDAGRAAAS